MIAQNNHCSLYRHFDKDGNLFYIGISLSAIQRLSQHRRSRWFDEIASIKIEKFKSRQDAARAEMIAIRTERPIFNIQLVNYKHEWDWVNEPPYDINGFIDEDAYPRWKEWAKIHEPNISFEKLESRLAEKREFVENYDRDYPSPNGNLRSVTVIF